MPPAEVAFQLGSRLDSSKMLDPQGLFGEFAAKLEFPAYFGHNWYALAMLDLLRARGDVAIEESGGRVLISSRNDDT